MVKPEEPLYDLSKLMEMSRNNDDFVKKMISLFISEIAKSTDKIKEAYSAGDFENLRFYAHRVKPSILSLGINSIKNEIMQIEAMAVNGEKNDQLTGMIQKVDDVIGIVIARLKTEHNC